MNNYAITGHFYASTPMVPATVYGRPTGKDALIPKSSGHLATTFPLLIGLWSPIMDEVCLATLALPTQRESALAMFEHVRDRRNEFMMLVLRTR